MARLRKLIEYSSDSDGSLPDMNTLLAGSYIKKAVSPSTKKSIRTTKTQQRQVSPPKPRVPSTSGLFDDLVTPKPKECLPARERSIVTVENDSANASPRKQRILKPLAKGSTLLNKLQDEELARKKKDEALERWESGTRTAWKGVYVPHSARNLKNKLISDAFGSPAVRTNAEGNPETDSDSDVPARRRVRRSPVKADSGKTLHGRYNTQKSTELEQIEAVLEETIICGSDTDEDSFILHSDPSEKECEDPRKHLTRPKVEAKAPKLVAIEHEDTLPLTANGLSAQPSAPRKSLRPESSSDYNAGAILTFFPANTRSLRKAAPVGQRDRPSTPPSHSPSKGLMSPTKQRPRIPTPPCNCPSSDDFWDPGTVNEWHDKYSPQKPLSSPHKGLKHILNRTRTACSSSDVSEPPSPITSSRSSPQKKAIASSRKAFESRKHDIAACFVAELDSKVTQNRLRDLTASAGGIKLSWSTKLATTAGRANWRREVIRMRGPAAIASNGATTSTLVTKTLHHASIELSTKVIDCDTRLYNVLAHEFCHLANFMISEVTARPHGAEFKLWAAKVSSVFAHYDVIVTTKHTYAITYKYVWACVGCATEYKRHSKSVDPKRHTCSVCRGRLVQIQPTPRANKESGERAMSEYQKFVKDNFKNVQDECKGLGHRAVMERLGQMYRVKKESSKIKSQQSDGLEKLLDNLSLR